MIPSSLAVSPRSTDLWSALGPLPDQVLEFAHRAARSRAPVLIQGETGTGKTMLARLIHEVGPRARGPFKRVNCGGVPEGLFEREMFGHVKGAFSDAREARPGLFEAADGGTLFLDEIGELPPMVQPKLLEALEESYIRRIGATSETPVNVRVIAATNRELREMVERGEFRQDLYFRLGFLRFRLPPLRERRDQIPEIARAVLNRICAEEGDPPRPVPALHPSAVRCLVRHDWPGNVRELEQVLTYALTVSGDPLVRAEHLPAELLDPGLAQPRAAAPPRSRVRYVAPSCPQVEKSRIEEALRFEAGNRRRAALRLGMSRATLWSRMHRYGLMDHWGEGPWC
jgi:transcriptional regulator with PAS, ATPase and Fis domain